MAVLDSGLVQGAFAFELEASVCVLRVRPDGRIEARWADDLCMTFDSWDWALERVPEVCAFLGRPVVLRLRRWS